MSGEYSSGLLSCCDDIGVCCTGICCPCYLAAKTIGEERPGVGCSTIWCIVGCLGLTPVSAWVARSRVQEAYNIHEDTGKRCLGFLCCCCGAVQLCQDSREVKKRNAKA